jgi:hypothetical protein
VGRPGRAASSDVVPRTCGAAHVPGRRRRHVRGGAEGQVRRGRGARHRAHPGWEGPLRRAGRRRGPSPRRRSGPQARGRRTPGVEGRTARHRARPVPRRSRLLHRSRSTRSSPPGARRRSRPPSWRRGTLPRSSGRACSIPSRSCTRTSCPVPRPASSPRT